jgi:hypothetical protein
MTRRATFVASESVGRNEDHRQRDAHDRERKTLFILLSYTRWTSKNANLKGALAYWTTHSPPLRSNERGPVKGENPVTFTKSSTTNPSVVRGGRFTFAPC